MSSSTFLYIFQSLLMNVHPRRLLLRTPLHRMPAQSAAAGPPSADIPANRFDANVVMILAVLLCAMIVAIGLNTIVRCSLRRSERVVIESPVDNVRNMAVVLPRSLPMLIYSGGTSGLPGTSSECAICLSEFAAGEQVRVLPKCNHGFHIKCIDRWLAVHSSCPTCRQCLFSTCIMTLAHGHDGQLAPEIIMPLEPEHRMINYGDGC